MKLGVFVSMISVGLAAFADPSITEVKAVQRYPWNGKVDISYKASGVESAAKQNGWLTSLRVTATDKESGTIYTATSVTGDSSVVDGAHAVVWDMSAQGLSFKSTNVVFDVSVVIKELGGVHLWENGPFWAECNVGATKPEEYGYYFWWGDTVGCMRNASNNGWISVKDGSSFSFKSGNCPTYGKSNSQLQSAGYVDATGNLVAAHDAATAHLGAPWRMPTDAEFSALISNCDTTWTTRGGVYGRLVKGKGAYASKSIYFPAVGDGYESYLNGTELYGSYWSSTSYSGGSDYAWRLYFDAGSFQRDCNVRLYGQSVRPLR